jgi:DivIVA domain-containing protein
VRSHQPDLPFDPKSLRPPPAWQAPPQPTTVGAWHLPVQRRGFDRDQVTRFLEDVTRQIEAREAGAAPISTNGILYTADEVRERRFATVRKGFDPEPVRSVLGELADRLEPLEAEDSVQPRRPDEPPSDDGDLGWLFS